MGLEESEHIGSIVVDPRDSNVVYVAAQGPLWSPGGDRGLYKTTDGGASWENVLGGGEYTGVNEVPKAEVLAGWRSKLISSRRIRSTDGLDLGASTSFYYRG